MDHLARDAMLAKQAGMSYGKWKAMQEPVEPEEPMTPDGWKVCPGCGKEFKPYDIRQKYCDVICRNEVFAKKRREQNRR